MNSFASCITFMNVDSDTAGCSGSFLWSRDLLPDRTSVGEYSHDRPDTFVQEHLRLLHFRRICRRLPQYFSGRVTGRSVRLDYSSLRTFQRSVQFDDGLHAPNLSIIRSKIGMLYRQAGYPSQPKVTPATKRGKEISPALLKGA